MYCVCVTGVDRRGVKEARERTLFIFFQEFSKYISMFLTQGSDMYIKSECPCYRNIITMLMGHEQYLNKKESL